MPRNLSVDQVYCSHQHADYNAAHLIFVRNIDPWNTNIITVPHDHDNGTKRGFSNIMMIHCDDIKIVHLGDIGRLPTQDEYALLKDTNVLMIPVGGYYTINSLEAKQIIQTIQPSLSILMHFREYNVGYDVLEDIESVMSKISNVQRFHTSTLEINKDLLKQQNIITLEPKQK